MRTNPVMAFGEETARRIADGDIDALLGGLVCAAAVWIERAGYSARLAARITPVDCVVHPDPAQGAAMACALNLLSVLSASPQGRDALATFDLEDVAAAFGRAGG